MAQVPYRRYLLLWPQLILRESVLYHKVKYPSMSQEKLMIVVPNSLQREFLQTPHDKAGHQGTNRTMARLSEIAKTLDTTITTALHVKSLKHQLANLLLSNQ